MSSSKETRKNKDGSYSEITTYKKPGGGGTRKTVTKERRAFVDHVRSVKKDKF